MPISAHLCPIEKTTNDVTAVIKSGGYKLSALDIEREILGLDYVSEVMVVGVDDEEFGQRVAAAIVLKPEVIGHPKVCANEC